MERLWRRCQMEGDLTLHEIIREARRDLQSLYHPLIDEELVTLSRREFDRRTGQLSPPERKELRYRRRLLQNRESQKRCRHRRDFSIQASSKFASSNSATPIVIKPEGDGDVFEDLFEENFI